MADKKATGKASKKTKAGGKAKKASTGRAKKATAKKAKRGPARKSAARKAPAKRAPKRAAPKRAGSKATSGLDKSVAQFRESLEHSVTLSRDRLQEVVDDAVKRGRMTRGDAEKMLSDLINRGRKQTDSLLASSNGWSSRRAKRSAAGPSRCAKQATQAARRARKKLG